MFEMPLLEIDGFEEISECCDSLEIQQQTALQEYIVFPGTLLNHSVLPSEY